MACIGSQVHVRALGRLYHFLLGALECKLFEARSLLKLHLLELALVVFVSVAHKLLQKLSHLQVSHRMTAYLVDLIIVLGGLDELLGLAVDEYDRVGDVDGAAVVGAFWRACKFLEQPVVVMLFIDKVIALFELDRVDLLYSIHLSQDAFLEAFAFL